jgi:hypothetical protein
MTWRSQPALVSTRSGKLLRRRYDRARLRGCLS